MLISPQHAQQILTDLTQDAPVPAAPGNLKRYDFQANGHVLIGETPVRGYKHKGRWRLVEKDIRNAARKLAALTLDVTSLAPVTAPSVLHDARSAEQDRLWRSRIHNWFVSAASRERPVRGCTCGQDPCRGDELGEDGLLCGLAMDTVRCGDLTLACTRPLPLLMWSGTQWMLPKAYADMLTRAEEAADRLDGKAATCSGCGAVGDRWEWRASGSAGFVTLCPDCASSTYQRYTDQLSGILYDSLGAHVRADAYLCCVCTGHRRAYYWDHCHDHGHIRGPVCASCNTFEGGGFDFISRFGYAGLRHLFRCEGCLKGRTLPRRHHADIVAQEALLEPHEGCSKRPRLKFGRARPDGSVSLPLSCWHRFDEPYRQWEQVVPADQVRALVRAFANHTLQSLQAKGLL
ncbi:endonuclease domain-containing protein [Streptomyces noursei]|uniref:endonuclease domain-containing protein n=1 Tax=Streptomyces noursei TaxID=1971 RepID=UPI00340D0637